MPTKAEALGILLVLLPGFTCAYVTQFVAVRQKQSDFDKVVEALLFALLLYLGTLPFFHFSLPSSWAVSAGGEIQVRIHYRQLLTLFLASVGLGLAYAANLNHDWALRLLRKCRITERTSRTAVWHDVFQETGGWIQVELKDGKKALGWVRYYSDDIEDRSLFLESASWINEAGEERPIEGPGLFLTRDAEIEAVLFLGNGIPEGDEAEAVQSSSDSAA